MTRMDERNTGGYRDSDPGRLVQGVVDETDGRGGVITEHKNLGTVQHESDHRDDDETRPQPENYEVLGLKEDVCDKKKIAYPSG